MSRDPRHLPRPELEVHARYVMLARLATEKRVLDIGGDTRSALLLAEAEVGELTVASADPRQLAADLAEAGVEGVDAVALPTLPLSFDDTAFDLIICHELGEWLREDPAWVGELRRVLAPEGYLVLALANPGGNTLSALFGQHFKAGLTYQDAFKELSGTFGKLTLFGQSAVVGNLFFDFESEADEPGLDFDRSLLPDEAEEPGWYLLIFGPEAVHRDELAIVQVPFQSLAVALAGHRDAPAVTLAPAESDLEPLEAERDELVKRVLKLQEDLQRARSQPAPAADEPEADEPEADEPEAADSSEATQALEGQLAAATAELDETRDRVRATEEKLAQTELKASDVAQQLDRARQSLEATASRLAEAEGQVSTAEKRVQEVETDHAQVLTAQEDALSSLKQQAALLSGELETARDGLTVASRERDDLQAALDAKKVELEEARDRALKTADEGRAQLETDLTARTTELEEVREKLRIAERTQGQLEAAIGDISKAKEVVLESLGQTEKARDQSLEELRQAQTELSQAQTELSGAREALQQAQTDTDEARAKLEAELTTLREEHAKLETELTTLRDTHTQAAAELATLREGHAKLETELTTLRDTHTQAAAELATLRDDHARLSDALKTAEAQRDELTTKGGADHERAADLDAALQQTREVLEQMKTRHQTEVAELEGQAIAARAQAEASAGRLQEVAEEQARQAKDRTSFEEQIKDLLEEASGLRDSEADLQKQLETARAQPPVQDPAVVEERDRLAKERDDLIAERDALAARVKENEAVAAGAKESEALAGRLKEAEAQAATQAETVRQEKVKNEELREELARVKMKHASLESEHEGLAAEVQRLTDLLHDRGAEAPAAERGEATVVAAVPNLSPSKDSAGRPIEKSLADIEDLIANSVPSPTNRR